ncbi:MAG: protein phosphatase CheZ [Rhodospirillaceae bacterium]|nr:protein phosphatase CheZ [Rhodospirillaceae bacterium]
MIFSELENLAGYIHDAKQEIAAIRPDEVKDDFLPKAEIELGAIVEATAEATHTIMDACDGLDGLMSQLEGDAASTLMDATTKIYEACTFQDITGQRINKVVKTLQHIEARVDKLIEVFEIKVEKSSSTNEQDSNSAENNKISDEDLLEGPQLKGQGRSQAEIDDLLASFD